MPSTTLYRYQHIGANWYTDPARVGSVYRDKGALLIYCVTTCPQCKRRIYGAFTAWGTVRVVFGAVAPKVG